MPVKVLGASLVALITVGALLAPSSGAVAGEVGADRGAEGRRATAAAARHDVVQIRSAVESGRLSEAYRAAISAPGDPTWLDLDAVEVPPVTTVGPLNASITRLLKTVIASSEAIRAEVPARGKALRSGLLRALTRREPTDRRTLRLVAKVDQAVFRSAGAAIAAEVDRILPQLRAFGPSIVPTRHDAACDVADVPGVLCVGGSGDNKFDDNHALVIDLGGNDVHSNSAGGADTFNNDLPVAVTIDVDGNDLYDPSAQTLNQTPTVQGAGFIGVGFLVDGSGDDTYQSLASAAGTHAMGQGMGLEGVGVMVDLDGNDSYVLDATAPVYATAAGLGFAGFGAALQIDVDGDDSYRVSAKPAPGLISFDTVRSAGIAVASGVGVAARDDILLADADVGPIFFVAEARERGRAVSYDGGGDDSYLVEAEQSFVGEDEVLPIDKGIAEATGFGYSLESVGLAIFESGSATQTLRAISNSPSIYTGAHGFGAAYVSGTAVLSDVGGNDTRILDASSNWSQEIHPDDSCECVEPTASVVLPLVEAIGMGYGELGAAGVLDDSGGNDRYSASASAYAEASGDDRRSEIGEGSAPVKGTAQTSSVSVKTMGTGGGEAGAGFLMDQSGDDVYETVATNQARAMTSPGGRPSATTGPTEIWSFAAGSGIGTYGEFRDLGGADMYSASSSGSATAEPQGSVTIGSLLAGALASVIQGGVASFLDSDDGATDTISIVPFEPACTGDRGQGTWADCGGAGVGIFR